MCFNVTVFTVFQGEYDNRFDYGQGFNRWENLVLDFHQTALFTMTRWWVKYFSDVRINIFFRFFRNFFAKVLTLSS